MREQISPRYFVVCNEMRCMYDHKASNVIEIYSIVSIHLLILKWFSDIIKVYHLTARWLT